MTALYLLIPLSLVLIAVAIGAFIWSVNSGQFDDLDGPAWQVLDDENEPQSGQSDDSAN